MKKICLGIFVLCAALVSNAQSTTFKPFKVDLALGYAIPGGSGSKGGVIVALEPKYAVNDNIALGLRMEAAVTARGFVDQNGETVSGSVKASGSYLLTGDYYFNTNQFRPFAGVGVGIYSLASAEVTESSSNSTTVVEGGTKFGFAPRAGFEFGHFRFAVEYNVAGKTGTINNNYLGFKLGFFIGGGRKSK